MKLETQIGANGLLRAKNLLNLKHCFGPRIKFNESHTRNLKLRFGPMVCWELKHAKLEALLRVKGFVESQNMLSLKPFFGPKVC